MIAVSIIFTDLSVEYNEWPLVVTSPHVVGQRKRVL